MVTNFAVIQYKWTSCSICGDRAERLNELLPLIRSWQAPRELNVEENIQVAATLVRFHRAHSRVVETNKTFSFDNLDRTRRWDLINSDHQVAPIQSLHLNGTALQGVVQRARVLVNQVAAGLA